MFANIIGTLLPTVVTLLLGFLAGWHHDFDTKQASVLNSMVMLTAWSCSMRCRSVSSRRGMARDQVLSQGPLAFAIFLGMAGGYAIVFFISHYLFRRDLMTASLQALAIAGPAAPFMGVSVLGHLFGNASAIPISIASLVMNLIQVPATLMLLSTGAAQKNHSADRKAVLAGRAYPLRATPAGGVGAPARIGANTFQPAFPGFDTRISLAARRRDRRRRNVCRGHRAVFVSGRL